MLFCWSRLIFSLFCATIWVYLWFVADYAQMGGELWRQGLYRTRSNLEFYNSGLPIGTAQNCEATCFELQRNRFGMCVIRDSLTAVFNLKQNDHESLQDFAKIFLLVWEKSLGMTPANHNQLQEKAFQQLLPLCEQAGMTRVPIQRLKAVIGQGSATIDSITSFFKISTINTNRTVNNSSRSVQSIRIER